MLFSEKNNHSTKLGPLLSICIPTFNRKDLVVSLVNEMLTFEGSFEVCVHVDGSTDGTVGALKSLDDARLRVSEGPNQGRAGALLAACQAARGRFTMVFDDDDVLYREGLRIVLADCETSLSPECVGYIYHLEDQDGGLIGDPFPVSRSNFLALRADNRVQGDKKEVILSDALGPAFYKGLEKFRRVPTSLLWSRLSIDSSVVCRNVVIGRKAYLSDGMTANIKVSKANDAYPMALLYMTHIRGFFNGRYRSATYLLKALVGVVFYGFRAAVRAALESR